ncbi:MAG TPA: tRNA (guanosine(37)-N1)-methyltransferase TrmD [Candidatus Brocadiia bacterium]|nr:tRNA (guanosine(37)-N1)-methyltransferase TrmD [Candidatus Brocadiia bacterium]
MRVDVLTIFPEIFRPALSTSIPGIAERKGAVVYRLHDIRDFATDSHRSVDDRPYGGGPGMVMKPDPIFHCVEAAEAQDPEPAFRILLTPQGERLTQKRVEDLALKRRLLIVCGHYEGFDERVREGLRPCEISVGDYVLSGGEFAAFVLIDAVVRLLPGVLGDADSAKDESFTSGLLEYPHYTRPSEFRGMKVPEILLSGDHAKVAQWRREQAILRTRLRRADLLPEEEKEKG